MKAILVFFDSLNRHCLPPYGSDWTHAPNFARLAKRAVTFDQSWVCSMPCMPARRDLHTGRPNFLHTPWCPLQPYDDSMPQMLRNAGVYTHLTTDHYHYFEDGGATYHNRYSSYQSWRGQEGDLYFGQVADPVVPPNLNGGLRPVCRTRPDWINRSQIQNMEDFPQRKSFDDGLAFMERNKLENNWFLQIETFDPHEPFYAPKETHKHYARAGETPIYDWPEYRAVNETPEEVERARHNYGALLTFCDENLGRVLDKMDALNLWEDTMLIVATDHGFMLGEHGMWAKNMPTMWNEIAHTPFFVWDPRSGIAGERRQALVQPAIDIPVTLLRYFGQEPTVDMTGCDLAEAIAEDTPVRKAALFGYFGLPVHCTDGRYVYMRMAADPTAIIYNHNWMPTKMTGFQPLESLALAEMGPPLPFSKGIPVPRIPWNPGGDAEVNPQPHLLFDMENDPGQLQPLNDPAAEARMIDLMEGLMSEASAPVEIYARYGLQTTTA